MKKIFKTIIILLTSYILFCILIYFNQEKLIFFPSKVNLSYDKKENTKEVSILTKDNIKLNAWFIDNKSDKTVIFMHWNGWNISYNQERIKIFDELKLNAIMFDYRGYGKSEWKIEKEADIYNDAESIYNYLINKWIKPTNIIIWWQSLGWAVAINLAQNKNVHRIIIESTFYSMYDMVIKQYPFLPIKLLLKYNFRNNDKIMNITSPMLLIHSKEDEIINFSNWENLFNKIKSKKEFLETSWWHNSWFGKSYNLYLATIKTLIK